MRMLATENTSSPSGFMETSRRNNVTSYPIGRNLPETIHQSAD
jgi:hypothetical protein